MNRTSITTCMADAGRLTAVCLLGIGQTALLICLPMLVVETRIGYGTFVALVALGTVLFLVATPLWGRVSDVIGRRPVVMIGLSGFLLSHALMLAGFYALSQRMVLPSTVVGILAIARVVYGLTVAGLYPAVQAWVQDEVTLPDRARALSRITAAISLGRLVGPLLTLLLVSGGVLLPFLALPCLALVPLLLLMPVCNAEHMVTSSGGSEVLAFRQLSLTVWPMFLLACWVTTAFGQLQYLIGPLLQEQLLFSPRQATVLLAELMMTAAISSLLTHLVITRFVNQHWLVAMRAGSTLLLTGCLILVLAEHVSAYFVGIAVGAASVTLLTPAYMRAASQEVRFGQGALTGTFTAIHTLGYSLGALLTGLALENGVDLALLMTGLISLMAFFTTFFLLGGAGQKRLGPQPMQ